MKRKIFIAALLCALGFGIFVFMGGLSTGEINMEKANIEVVTSPINLLSAFEEDEISANEKYASKVIKVTGSLSDIKTVSETNLQLVLQAENSIGNVVCNLQSDIEIELENLKIGDLINIKGMCTGYMFDVVMDHCIIIN